MPFAPATDDDLRHMLDVIGVSSVDELYSDLSPSIQAKAKLDLPLGVSELELQSKARAFAENTIDCSASSSLNFLGLGSWDHYVPAVCRAISSRSEYATAYTPYQPELSQGTLQTIFEFQSSISALTGLPVANASLYDGATAAAEAVYLAEQTTRRSEVVVLESVSPQIRKVIATYAKAYGMIMHTVPVDAETEVCSPDSVSALINDNTAAVLVQQPNAFGRFEDAPSIVSATNEAGAVSIVHAEALSLGVLEAPGAYGAGVVVGEGQPLGCAPSFGGPTFGFMAADKRFMRRMPGRIVGETRDLNDDRGYVLTLQTREQHIRREKATSNICTNQALCALNGVIYLSWLGPNGLREMGELLIDRALTLRDRLLKIDGVTVKQPEEAVFRDLLIELPVPAAAVIDYCAKRDILAGLNAQHYWPHLSENSLLLAATEQRTDQDFERLATTIEAAISEVSA